MSLAINTTTPEGVVLVADSRQSYRNQKGISRIGSDSASKLFLINERIGVAVVGRAFLEENGIQKNISKFIEQYKRSEGIENLSVKEVADQLQLLFDEKVGWKKQLDQMLDQIKTDFSSRGIEVLEMKKEEYRILFKVKEKDGSVKEGVGNIDGVTLFVAGYNLDGSHEVYNVYSPGKTIKRRDSKQKGIEYGANWIGQTDVVSRIIKGWDPRLFNIPLMVEVLRTKTQEEVEKQLNGLEYSINWGTMTLQDAVDFSVLAVQTTSAIQRFSDGIQTDPGEMPGVGGPIDVLVITPDGPKWIKQKEIKVE
jgi:hypothetical protein